MVKRLIASSLKWFLFTGILILTGCANGPVGGEKEAESDWLKLFPLRSGEELAVLHTNKGDIKLRFFPDKAPLAVENFVTHAKNGYYDGVIFHRVIDDFMIQGGDPLGTGSGGESIWGGTFGYEFDVHLRHYRGALAMAHSSAPASNGSQFYIVQNKNLNSYYKNMFEEMRGNQNEIVGKSEEGGDVYLKEVLPVEAIDLYMKGGVPHLDVLFNDDTNKAHTVFGHVVAGMDVVDAIATVKVVDAAKQNYKPVDDVIIKSVSFETAP